MLRDYTSNDNPRISGVEENYRKQHTYMTYDKVMELEKKWCKFDHGKYSIYQILQMLNTLVDESDPDLHGGNSIHAFQTAESLRKAYPEEDWLHLVGLIHDLGKFMALCGEPQWCVVGDTFPIGCEHSKDIVFHKHFKNNNDVLNKNMNTKLGIYKPNCGLENLVMAWGHDEYLFRVLKNHKTSTIPREGLLIIRYHSFYPWHSNDSYKYLLQDSDKNILHRVKKFNTHDLYSKSHNTPSLDACTELWNTYYAQLCIKYGIGDLISW